MVYTTYYNSPVGRLLLAEEDGALVGLWMEGQKYFLGSLKRMPREERCTSVLRQTKDWLGHYFAGEQPAIGQLPLAPKGSAFQQEVWRVLCDIPYGHLTTYGEIARKIAAQRGLASMSAQAVGGAVGHNPISIVIPCHRVVGAGGSLTGYAGGVEKKLRLLTLEGVSVEGLSIPLRGTAL